MERDNETAQAITPLDTTEGKVQLAVYVITVFVGSVGNILVLFIVKAKRSRRTVNDLFIMNLAIADLTLIAFLPLYVYDLLEQMQLTTGLCKFVPVMTMTYFISIFTLTFMAVHRCYVILNPFRPDMRHRTVCISIGIVWLISAIFILPLVVVSVASDDGTLCIETWPTPDHKRAYTASLVVLQYVLPLTIISVAYIRIIFDLNHTSGSKFDRHTKVHQQFRKENLQIVKTLATIVILFAVCLLPGQVVWMLLDFGSSDHKSLKTFFSASIILNALHSCLNPIVYGTLTKQFRREYMRYLSYLFPCCLKRWDYSQQGLYSQSTPATQDNNNKQTLLEPLSNGMEPSARESRL